MVFLISYSKLLGMMMRLRSHCIYEAEAAEGEKPSRSPRHSLSARMQAFDWPITIQKKKRALQSVARLPTQKC